MNQGFYLSLRVGATDPQPVPPGIMDDLREVQVNSASSGQSGFQLKFTLGKNSIINRQYLPSGFFDPSTRVIIIVTVNGTPYVLMDGAITKQDVTPSNEPGQSTLTLTGLDLSVYMDFVDLTGFPWPAMPPNIVVMAILAKYAIFGVIPVAIPSIVAFIENPLEKIPGQVGTDLNYINMLGRKVGHVFYIDPGPSPGQSTAYWGPEIRFGSPQRALTVNWDADTNVDTMSCSHDGLMRKQLLITILEPNTKIPIPIPVPEPAILKPTLAARGATILKTQILSEVSKLKPAQAVLVALSGVTGSSDAVTASGQLDVNRYGGVLAPRKIVAVRGAGVLYDGLYFVKSVTHQIKRGEYKQSFSLVRGGVESSVQTVPA